MASDDGSYLTLESPSSRRAWIEIRAIPSECLWTAVALLAEGVDRNLRHGLKMQGAYVALLAEGVDRNSCAWPPD